MPDKVGDAKESWKRCIYSMPELEQYDSRRWLLPVQNGQDIGLAVDFALAHGCGLFIGGMTIDGPKKQWKHETVAKIRDISKRVYVHVGSLSAAKDLKRACAAGVESYDTTTYLMNVGWNARQDWMPRMKRFVERDATIVMPEEMQ